MATKFWVSTNESSRAPANRRKYVLENGGSFKKTKKGWVWTASATEPVVAKPAEKKKKRIFKGD